MRNRTIASIAAVVLASLVLLPAALAQTAPPQESGQGQGRGGRRANAIPPPGPPHDPHDLSGTWMQFGSGLGGGGGGRPQTGSEWSTEPLPLTPAGLAKLNGNHPGKGPRAGVPAKGNDPLSDANVPGLLRTLVYGRPFQLLPTEDKIVQIFEWFRIWREIWTDGRKMPEDPDPRFYGYSVSKWDGDTLVVETAGLDPRLWGDEWGMPFSEDMRLEERWRRVDRDNLQLTITFTDPQMYTKPWTSEIKRFRLQSKGMPDAEMLEVIFTPMDEQDFDKNIRNPSSFGVAGPKSGVR
jgi:hypothetical protein